MNLKIGSHYTTDNGKEVVIYLNIDNHWYGVVLNEVATIDYDKNGICSNPFYNIREEICLKK